jgi:hypothetical protein
MARPYSHPIAVLALVLLVAAAGCSADAPTAPDLDAPPEASVAVSLSLVGSNTTAASKASPRSCWGQATQVFARMGEMGEHSSGFPTPRLGLRNLARALYEQGVLEDDSLQALGAFVARELGLEIDACL